MGIRKKSIRIQELERRLMLDASVTGTAGLALWLDASDTSTLFDADGDDISGVGGNNDGFSGEIGTWQDKSGNNNHATQTDATRQASWVAGGLNGLDILNFDGNDVLNAVDSASLDINGNGLTIFAVINPTNTGGDNVIVGKENSWLYAVRGGTQSAAVATADPGGWSWGNSAGISTGWNVTQFQHDDTTWEFYQDGVLAGERAPANNEVGNITPSNNQLSVGGRNGTGQFDGDIAEIIVFDRALSTQEAHDIENYLAAKWGQIITNATPTVDTNVNTDVINGNTLTLTPAMLSSSDTDNTDANLTYTVTSTPGWGSLYRSGVLIGPNDTFTQQDIINGIITYQHGGGGAVPDSFQFTVDDGLTTTATQTFNFTILDENEPNVLTNTGVSVQEATTTTITTAMLNIQDNDTAAAGITINVTAGLTQGHIEVNNVVQNSFTLAQLQSGLVEYVHTGAQTDDSFTFSTSDGVTTLTGFVFNIDVNETPIILANSTVVANEDFEGGAAGWSDNTTYNGGTELTQFLGRFNREGAQGGQDVSKTFNLSGTQESILIEFDFYELDDWDNENFLIYINDQLVISQQYNRETFDQENAGSLGNISWTVQEKTDYIGDLGSRADRQDQIVRYQIRIDTTDANIKLGFGSTLDSTNNNDESWGLDNLVIREYANAGAPTFNVSELAPNGDLVGTVIATNPENDQTVTFTNVAGGTGDGIFSIDANGNITVIDASVIDYESGTTSYTLIVRATDDGPGALSVDQTVTINLVEADERVVWTAPPNPWVTVSEGTANGTIVGDVSGFATDPEGDAIIYVIEAGNNDGIFSIDENTGVITVSDNTNLNREYDNSYTLRISARSYDNNGASPQTDRNFVISISDVDEAPTLDPIQAVLNENPNVIYNAATGNFYQYVNSAQTYGNAQTLAAGSTINGVGGHLVTITSAAENAFVQGIIGNTVWLGGRDAAVEGQWVWEGGGDENGVQFSNAAGDVQNGLYTNWNPGEPNNNGGVEDHAEMRTNGTWNDRNGGSLRYVIEWEGRDIFNATDPAGYNGPDFEVDHANPDGSDVTNGTVVGTVFGYDPEGDTLTYSITAGDPAGLFAIDANGQITIADATQIDATIQDVYNLTIRVTEDNGLNQTADRAITVTFNEIPNALVNNGITLNEGATVTITTAELNINDTDDAASDVVFNVQTIPANGQLELTSAAGTAITSFTLDDLNNNRVVFVHNGSETTSDSFTFTVTDGSATSALSTFNITVTPVNDAPLINNLGSVTGAGRDVDSSAVDAIANAVLHFDATDLDGDGDVTDQPAPLAPDDPEAALGAPLTTGAGSDTFGSTGTQFPQTANSFMAVDVIIPAVPTGGIFEAGGSGRGIYMGFDNANNFVFRAGDGANATTNMAAILRTASTDLVGKTGTIFAEINIGSDSVTAWFLEGGVGGGGTPILIGTATASAGFESGQSHGGGGGGLNGTGSNVGGENNSRFSDSGGVVGNFRFYTNALSPISAGGGGLPIIDGDTWHDQAGSGAEINDATGTGAGYDGDGFAAGVGGVDPSGAGLSIAQSTDYNDSASGDRSFAMSFKTGASVAGTQVILDHGGGTNGYNFTIVDGNMYAYAFLADGATASVIDLGPVLADTIYNLTAIHDVGPDTWTATLNGTTVTGANIGEIVHGDEGALGNNVNGTRDPTNPTTLIADGASAFDGLIGELRTWNTALDAAEKTAVENYLSAKWGSSALTVQIAENAMVNDSIVDAEVFNPEDFKGETITWSITGGNDGTFAIDANTGEVTIVNTANIDFEDGSNIYNLTVRATDSGVDAPGILFDEKTFTIEITDINEAPTIDTNVGATMDEGTSLTITNVMLAGSDQDAADTNSDITYTASGVTNGHIEVGGVAQNTFTQADIDNGDVVFIHDGSETLTAGFNISLADGGENGTAAALGAFNIIVNPVNDAPVIVNNTGAVTEIDFSTAVINPVASQDGSAGQPTSQEILGSGTTLKIEGNSWKAVALPYTITANTVIEFEFMSTNEGEIHGFAFSSNTSWNGGTDLAVELFGTDPNGGFNQTYNDYTLADGWKSYSIPIGTIGTGAFNHLFFIADDDAGGAADAFFRNVRIYEGGTPTVNEGGTLNITTAHITENDPDDSGTGLTYTVTSGPANGQLELTTNLGTAINSFTQDDLDNGRVIYVHDGSETTSDSFDFSLADGGEDLVVPATSTFHLSVVPVDDAPVTTVNNGVSLNEGATATIGVGQLTSTDADTDPSIITYNVTAAPANGQLELNTNPGAAITSFTQDDINNGRVVYVHDGGETTADTFSFSVTDGSTTLAVDTFGITVNPVNDAPTLNNSAMNVGIGNTKTVLPGELDITDPDNTNAEIVVTITNNPAEGQLELTGNPGVVATTFTYQQLINGEVIYVHGGGVANDTFQFTFTDGAIASGVQTFNITMVGNTDPVLTPTTFNLDENVASTTLVGRPAASDAEEPLAALNFTILSGNDDGIFAIGANGDITVADNTNLNFEGTNTYSLLVRVEDSLGGIDTETITININDINEQTVLDTNAGATMDEGDSLTITGAMLSGSDADIPDDAANITYTASNLVNGVIEVSGIANNTFTQADIDNGNVVFIHDGSETLAGGFDFSLADGLQDGTSAVLGTFNIIVTPVDDNPVLTANNAVTLNEGSSIAITLAELNATDIDTVDSTLRFNVTAIDGQVELTSAAGTAVSSFTIDDLANNRVVYVHDGAENASAGFNFALTDGTNTLATSTLVANITPVNDAPDDITIDGDSFMEESSNGTVIGALEGSDVDGPALSFRLLSGAENFAIENGNLVVNAFMDFETIGDPVFEVTIEVSDGSLSFDKTFEILIRDFQEPTQDIIVRAIESNDTDVQTTEISEIITRVEEIRAGQEIIRDNIVMIRDGGDLAKIDEEVFESIFTGIVIESDTFVLEEQEQIVVRETLEEDMDFTNLREAFAFLDQLDQEIVESEDGEEESGDTEQLLSQIEHQFQDVMKYYEDRQGRLKDALSS